MKRGLLHLITIKTDCEPYYNFRDALLGNDLNSYNTLNEKESARTFLRNVDLKQQQRQAIKGKYCVAFEYFS